MGGAMLGYGLGGQTGRITRSFIWRFRRIIRRIIIIMKKMKKKIIL
jgi:hypothetical protein